MVKYKKSLIVYFLTMLFIVSLLRLGFWIVDTDKPIKSDIIWILMGSYGERALLAADLYKLGYSSKIVMAQPYNDQQELLKKNGVYVSADENVLTYILKLKGVEPTAINVVPGGAKNTTAEANDIANYCMEHPEVKTITIVTSTYHTGRARKIIGKVLAKNKIHVNFVLPSNKYTDYHYEYWYLRQNDIIATISETVKTIYYLCWAQW